MRRNNDVVVYPGSFDPLTNGHLDLIKRATNLFSKIIVAIITNPNKCPTFSVAERKKMIEVVLKKNNLIKNVVVDVFDGLLVDYLKKISSYVVLRGLRVMSDFEYEFQMALTNRKLLDEIEIIYLMPDERWSYISSSLVKEIAKYNGDISDFVPKEIEGIIKRKFR